jgi:hypothetical protein
MMVKPHIMTFSEDGKPRDQEAEGEHERERGGHPADPLRGAKADGVPGDQQDRHRPALLDRVGDDAAGQRRPARDRQGPQPVEESLLQVGAQAHAAVHGGHQSGLDNDAGQHELKVVHRITGDRTAEQVGEQKHEHDRLEAEVAQLHRVVADLDQPAPGQGKTLPHAETPSWVR